LLDCDHQSAIGAQYNIYRGGIEALAQEVTSADRFRKSKEPAGIYGVMDGVRLSLFLTNFTAAVGRCQGQTLTDTKMAG